MTFSFNNFLLDAKNFTLSYKGKAIEVEPRVFDLIVYLIEHRDNVVTRNELFETVWKGRDVVDATLSNHIKIARQILGDTGQSQHTIKTFHGRGYQFIAQTNEKAKVLKVQFITKKLLFALLIFLALALFSTVQQFRAKKANGRPLIAVLPFVNTNPTPESDYFSIAIADQIIGHLNYLQNITVRPTASIRKHINVADPILVGEDLNADYILTGTYLKQANTIRLSIELVEVSTSNLIWRGNQIEVEDNNAFELQDIISRKVIDHLKIEFSSSEIKRINQDVSSNSLAYEYYLRGVAYPNSQDGNLFAIEMLVKSIELDPDYALTYLQLGDRIHRYHQYGLTTITHLLSPEKYYLKALNLNPDLLDALSKLSMLYTETNRIDQAIVLANRMATINPTNAFTHFTLGYIYRYAGNIDNAIEQIEQAVRLDPHNSKFRSIIGTYSGARMFHKALKMTDQYKKSTYTIGWKGLLNFQLGNYPIALDYFNQVIEEDKNGLWANVAIIHKSFIEGNNQAGLHAVEKLVDPAETDGETLYYVSAYYALLGNKENSIIALEKSINAGYYNYPFMLNNWYYDSINTDKQFKQLLKRAQSKQLDFKESLVIH